MSDELRFRANVTLFTWSVGGLITAFLVATALYWQVQGIDKELKEIKERMEKLEQTCGKRDAQMEHIQLEFQKVKDIFHPPSAMDWNGRSN